MASVFNAQIAHQQMVDCIKKVFIEGEAKTFVRHEYTSIPAQFPLAWADSTMRDLIQVAFHAFKFEVQDNGDGTYILNDYPPG
jgi:hypothetical protein